LSTEQSALISAHRVAHERTDKRSGSSAGGTQGREGHACPHGQRASTSAGSWAQQQTGVAVGDRAAPAFDGEACEARCGGEQPRRRRSAPSRHSMPRRRPASRREPNANG